MKNKFKFTLVLSTALLLISTPESKATEPEKVVEPEIAGMYIRGRMVWVSLGVVDCRGQRHICYIINEHPFENRVSATFYEYPDGEESTPKKFTINIAPDYKEETNGEDTRLTFTPVN